MLKARARTDQTSWSEQVLSDHVQAGQVTAQQSAFPPKQLLAESLSTEVL
jgi:hypothetical protein